MANYLQLGREIHRLAPVLEGSPLMVYNEKALKKLGKNNPNLTKALNEVIGKSTNPSLEILSKANGNYGIASFRIKSGNNEILSGAYSKSEEASGIVEKYHVLKDGVVESSHTPKIETKSVESKSVQKIVKEVETKGLLDEMTELGQSARNRQWIEEGAYDTAKAENAGIKTTIEGLNNEAKKAKEYAEKIIGKINREIESGNFEYDSHMKLVTLDNGKLKIRLLQGITEGEANIYCYNSKLYPKKFDMNISVQDGKITSITTNNRANNSLCNTKYEYNNYPTATYCIKQAYRDIEASNMFETIKILTTNGNQIAVYR